MNFCVKNLREFLTVYIFPWTFFCDTNYPVSLAFSVPLCCVSLTQGEYLNAVDFPWDLSSWKMSESALSSRTPIEEFEELTM